MNNALAPLPGELVPSAGHLWTLPGQACLLPCGSELAGQLATFGAEWCRRSLPDMTQLVADAIHRMVGCLQAALPSWLMGCSSCVGASVST